VGMERNYEDWAADAGTLHELAQELLPQSPKVQVRLPRVFADRAVAAWQRDEDLGDLSRETDRQRSIRDDAGTLALIGQSIEETGIEDGDDVVFKVLVSGPDLSELHLGAWGEADVSCVVDAERGVKVPRDAWNCGPVDLAASDRCLVHTIRS